MAQVGSTETLWSYLGQAVKWTVFYYWIYSVRYYVSDISVTFSDFNSDILELIYDKDPLGLQTYTKNTEQIASYSTRASASTNILVLKTQLM